MLTGDRGPRSEWCPDPRVCATLVLPAVPAVVFRASEEPQPSWRSICCDGTPEHIPSEHLPSRQSALAEREESTRQDKTRARSERLGSHLGGSGLEAENRLLWSTAASTLAGSLPRLAAGRVHPAWHSSFSNSCGLWPHLHSSTPPGFDCNLYYVSMPPAGEPPLP